MVQGMSGKRRLTCGDGESNDHVAQEGAGWPGALLHRKGQHIGGTANSPIVSVQPSHPTIADQDQTQLGMASAGTREDLLRELPESGLENAPATKPASYQHRH